MTFGGLDEIEMQRLGVDDRPGSCPECGHNSIDEINRMVENGETMLLVVKTADALVEALREGRDDAELAEEWKQLKKKVIG